MVQHNSNADPAFGARKRAIFGFAVEDPRCIYIPEKLAEKTMRSSIALALQAETWKAALSSYIW